MRFLVVQNISFWSAKGPFLHCDMAVLAMQKHPNGRAKRYVLVSRSNLSAYQTGYRCGYTTVYALQIATFRSVNFRPNSFTYYNYNDT